MTGQLGNSEGQRATIIYQKAYISTFNIVSLAGVAFFNKLVYIVLIIGNNNYELMLDVYFYKFQATSWNNVMS